MTEENLDFYTLDEIRSKTDLNGNKPSLYIISGDRSAGKTTSVLDHMTKHFLETGRKFGILVRTQLELSGTGMIFNELLARKPEYNVYGDMIEDTKGVQGVFRKLCFTTQDCYTEDWENDGKIEKQYTHCGYVVSMSNQDRLKKYSPAFQDVDIWMFDEFQIEKGKYLKNEVETILSIILSVGRGGGKAIRDIELYMLSNKVSLINPYFVALGISKRLRDNTHFMRGNGWILEIVDKPKIRNAIQNNNLVQAFSTTKYASWAIEGIYLNNDKAFIKKPSGLCRYILSILYSGHKYGIYEYTNGLVYVTSRAEDSFKTIVTVSPSEHNENTLMFAGNSNMWKSLKNAFTYGLMRFSDAEAKNMMLDVLGLYTSMFATK